MGWRSQNEPMSLTVACARPAMASPALTLTFGAGCDPPLGGNARMTVSQNAYLQESHGQSSKLSRPFWRALERTIAARLEAQVGDGAHFLPIFEFNQLRCFEKFELPAFASNLRQWAGEPRIAGRSECRSGG